MDADLERLLAQVPPNMSRRVYNAVLNLEVESLEELRALDPVVVLGVKSAGPKVLAELLFLGVWPDVPSVKAAIKRWPKKQREELSRADETRRWRRYEQRRSRRL